MLRRSLAICLASLSLGACDGPVPPEPNAAPEPAGADPQATQPVEPDPPEPDPTPNPPDGAAGEPVESTTPPEPAAPSRPNATHRERAAYGMLIELGRKAELMPKYLPDETDRGCPTSLSGVTWGIAKTDPWGESFAMRCDDETGRVAQFSSAGADRTHGTADDIHGALPWRDPVDACAAGCASVECTAARGEACEVQMCGDQPEPVVDCEARCRAAPARAQFHVDTCAHLRECRSRMECVTAALEDRTPWGDCREFGQAAAAAANKPAAARRLARACREDVLRVPELLCVREATTARSAALCHLTVNRGWPADL